MTAPPPIRVLVVDDSAFVRKVVSEYLVKAGMLVVGTAQDGLEALELIQRLSPDVITLDLVMPNLDGVGVLNALAGKPAPRVVVVSTCEADSMAGVAALQVGGFEVIQKPSALADSGLHEIEEKLVAAVRAAGLAIPPTATEAPARRAKPMPLTSTRELVVVGASTGGPQALTRLASTLPANFPVAIAVVLHIPPGYTAALATRLDASSKLEVVEASEGVVLKPGRVVIARAGHHLKLARKEGRLVCKLELLPRDSLHRPSIDVLFESAAKLVGAKTLGVVLTGMGDDGLAGARAIHAAGGSVITEAASSCVVYGMPRAVVEAGLSAAEAPIERMVEEIVRFL